MSDLVAWAKHNQGTFAMRLAIIKAALSAHADPSAQPSTAAPDPIAPPVVDPVAPAAIDALCFLFDLSPFERDILLLCAGIELDSAFAPLCAAAQGDPQANYPTFGLALACLPEAHWTALSPAAPLRHWGLIQLESGRTLTRSPLRIDERLLNYLLGIDQTDERLIGLLRPCPLAESDPAPSHRALAERIASAWTQAISAGDLPVIQLCGGQIADKRMIAAAASASLGLTLFRLSAQSLPIALSELETLRRVWEREALLSGSALLLDCESVDRADSARESAISSWIESSHSVLIVASRDRRTTPARTLLTFDVPLPSHAEQKHLWLRLIGANAESADESRNGQFAAQMDSQLDRLVTQFDFDLPTVRAAWTAAQGQIEANGGIGAHDPDTLAALLWEECRVQARPDLEALTRRIEPVARWEDLVLPAPQLDTLREIAIHIDQRTQVYEAWGFAGKGTRGLGISALFAGLSGTGKTLAAEVLASALRLDLYRIDLSSMVSKYIGETEKNLRRVFDAAESSGAILLFDEADALFGKRSEVKDSHDRYANIEVSYLLQRMETYRGLAILTSNHKEALDTAFLRRLRFIIDFPFPDAAQRAEIWRRIFPEQTPLDRLDLNKLARLNIAGGSIRNIALHAAFLAADAGQPVQMLHILRAARREYAKLDRQLTDAEIREWQ